MKASTVFLVFLGLLIAGVGGIFTFLMGQSYQRAVEQRAWPQVDALVLSSELEEWQHDDFSPMEYRMKILYGYEWEGERKTGERFGFRGNPKYNKRNKVMNLVESFPVGKTVKIFVNPEDPSFTILKPDSKAPGYSIWFPLLFVVGGLGISARALFRRPHP
ncbi:MAG: DUF3592 domain-containing protein [Akkermansiaceae bacterium]